MTMYLQYGTGDDPGAVEVRPSRTCPECRGSCEDKRGDPCEFCAGEGEI